MPAFGGCQLEVVNQVNGTNGGHRSPSPASSAGSSTGRPLGSASSAAGSSTGAPTSSGAVATGTGGTTGTMRGPGTTGTGGSGCTIDGQSYPALSVNALDPAQCCNPALSATDWMPLFVETMTTPVASDTLEGPNDQLVADLNGDGIADILVTTYTGVGMGVFGATQVWVYLSQDGGYAAPATYFSPLAGESGPGWITLGDLNRDGIPDLVISSAASLAVRLGTGGGQFGDEQSIAIPCAGGTVRVIDVDGDDWLDVALGTSCGLYLFKNDKRGDGLLTSSTLLVDAATQTGLAVGDFNQDGHPDLAYLNSAGAITWLENVAGSFTQPADQPMFQTPYWAMVPVPTAFGAALFVTGASNGPDLTLPSPDGPQFAKGFSPSFSSGAVAVGDVNGDGLPDLLVGGIDYNDPSIGVVLSVASSAANPLQVGAVTGTQDALGRQQIHALATGDLNGDGTADLVVFRESGPWETWINTCGSGAARTLDPGTP